MDNTFNVPKEWEGQQVNVAFPIPVQTKEGVNFAQVTGQFTQDLGNAILLRLDKGDLIIPKTNIHTIMRISSLTLNIPPVR